jgi:hypothetical protein
LTLREFDALADRWDEQQRIEDLHYALILCQFANANRDPKRKPAPFTPDDFNPMVRRDRKAGAVTVTKENIGDMRAMFESMKQGRRVQP